MNADAEHEHTLYLPDFCTSRATLAIVLIGELTAFVLTLARQSAVREGFPALRHRVLGADEAGR